MKAKVLILTNPLNHEGGIVNYYNLFFKHFESNVISLAHASIGSRAYLFYYPILKRVLYPLYYLFDVLVYVLKLILDRKIKIVQVSPSLIPVPLIRDGLLVILAKLLGKKVVVFYRGWKFPTYQKLEENNIIRTLFNFVFQKNTTQVVLASSFKSDLLRLDSFNKTNIIVTTTAIDKNEIIHPLSDSGSTNINILFLGRIQNLKGVEELIEAISLLNENGQLDPFNFSIVGHENKIGYIQKLKEKLKSHNVPENKVSFLGRITGKDKFELYSNNDVYVLPSYTEGCPNSVLEALASGLFCITTPVGALEDIINQENGIFVPVKSVVQLHKAFLLILENNSFLENRKKISNDSIEKYDIRKICKDFQFIYYKLIDNEA